MRDRLRKVFIRRPKPRTQSTDDQAATESDTTKLTAERATEPAPFKLLELPRDLRSSTFSKSTLLPSVSDLPRLRRLQRTREASMDHFRLLDLPVELRLNIFAHHFGNRTVAATLDAKTMEVTAKRDWYAFDQASRAPNGLAIILSCKQLREEAESVLWDSTIFVVKMKVEATVVVGGVAYLSPVAVPIPRPTIGTPNTGHPMDTP
ncbi:hypothetical protein LTR37_015868 [Vermiconidia calcicola]|uniref:Uncharacterized protein n=1 Tax=Vermiconidia calcicola TaxID=1690605 RepID=A0ACC3MPN2_9PEZI|nr:hypothetical protein LTR37_015868 [Vermiconidia calcicola]